jgi:hypothetical protein
MPSHILLLAVAYLAVLVGVFIAYFTSPWLRMHIPANLGPMPAEVVWFGATGGVMVSLYGIFLYNQKWDTSYNYWHYCRPLFGAVTGSIGALMYLVLLHLGSTSSVKVDPSIQTERQRARKRRPVKRRDSQLGPPDTYKPHNSKERPSTAHPVDLTRVAPPRRPRDADHDGSQPFR